MADLGSNTPIPTPRPTNVVTGFASAPQAPADTIQRVAAQASTIGQLHFPDEKIKYYMSIGLSDYNPTFNGSADPIGLNGGTGGIVTTTISLTNQIVLPLPLSLRDLQTVNYTEKGMLQEGFEIAAKIIGGTAGIVGGIMSQSVAAGGKGLLIGGGVGAVASGVGQAAGDAASLMGYAPNQMLTILLSGPKYKRHSFEWDLAPKTPSEAKALKDIIKLLNNSMAPSLGGGVNDAGFLRGLYWTWPKIFSLSFSPNQDYLFKFKPSVLQSFAVDYSGGHVPSFLRADGETQNQNPPESIKLVMEFIEIEFWKSGDFRDLGSNANQAELNEQAIATTVGGVHT